MSEEEKKFINKVNTDKAKNKIKLCLMMIVRSCYLNFFYPKINV